MRSINLIRNLFLSLLLFVSVVSCKKFLDEIPDNSIAVPTTLPQVQALLDNASKMNLNCTPNFGEGSSDDYFIPDAAYNALDVESQGIYTWNRADYLFQNDWSKAYEPIYISNYSLEALDNIAVNDTNRLPWNNAKGSALYYRSYFFLKLLWVFAKAYDENQSETDLGIALRLNSDFNIPSVRSNVKACYQQVLTDTKAAIPLLPDLPVHVLRPSKSAAYGLLARAYLSMRVYDSAFLYADKALALKNSLMNFNADSDIPNGVNASIPFKPFNKETIYYSFMSTAQMMHTTTRARIDTAITASYHLNDLRRKAFLIASGSYHRFKGSFTGTSNHYFTGITTAEMKLIKSECLARAGNTGSALSELNELLQTRWDQNQPFQPVTASTPAEVLSKILLERRKELYMRGLRWMDIKRLNKEAANIVLTRKIEGQSFTLQPNAPYFALPLPEDVIRLSGMPQNPR
jgi:hypothetical protein